jgi:hypothetical protein
MKGAFALLKGDSPLRELFGSDWVPIQNFIAPAQATLENLEGVHEVYLVDVRRLGPEVLERCIDFMARTHGSEPEVVRFDVTRDGHFPMRAFHVLSTGTDDPWFL